MTSHDIWCTNVSTRIYGNSDGLQISWGLGQCHWSPLSIFIVTYACTWVTDTVWEQYETRSLHARWEEMWWLLRRNIFRAHELLVKSKLEHYNWSCHPWIFRTLTCMGCPDNPFAMEGPRVLRPLKTPWSSLRSLGSRTHNNIEQLL